MSHYPRLFPGDEELGKRDDDHKYRPRSSSISWHRLRLPSKRSLRKAAIGLFVLVAIYCFIRNMPEGIERSSNRPNYSRPPSIERTSRPPSPAISKPETTTTESPSVQEEEKEKHWFNGPIKFYDLADSLYAISATRGSSLVNRNVLFTASSLKSASTLISMACEMATWERNSVHFAFMGRDDISMAMLQEVNGVTKSCNVWFHDARPDFSLESSDFRMEVSCGAALGHINTYMHPQAVIVDKSEDENPYFLNALRQRSAILGRPLIELSRPGEDFRWITRLDSSSLMAFNKISIDILIHAQPSAAGSLMRLLTSLAKADYFDLAPPRLSIELPYKVDAAVTNFLLDSFKWPPSATSNDASAPHLHLQKRIPQRGISPEESSTRFLESFWPANRFTSHVLLLSPQTELSPLYYHYLKYAILEYKYSRASATSPSPHDDLLGISLDLPSTFLNDTAAFTAPVYSESTKETEGNGPSFLWGAPNSNAALYFGDKWTELHTLASYSLASPTEPSPKKTNKYYVPRMARIHSLPLPGPRLHNALPPTHRRRRSGHHS